LAGTYKGQWRRWRPRWPRTGEARRECALGAR
jgi:hypothetical protein